MNIIKLVLILSGTLSLLLGLIGIFIPGLPVTPFLLLTAGLYVRSSDRLYSLLTMNKITGPYILKFRKNKGMTGKMKIYAISMMWFMISVSCIFCIDVLAIKLIVMAAGIIGTIVMAFFVPTVDIHGRN